MKGQVSRATRRVYPLTMICAVYRVARSSVYAVTPPPSSKPGPKTATVTVRCSRRSAPSWPRARFTVRAIGKSARGWRTGVCSSGGKRVLRLMRAHGLLAPRRLGPPNGDPAHAGTITTTRPDEMWGTDATRFYTEQDGWCWFFGAIDHAVDEIVGWHTAKIGDRWAALEPIRQGVRHAFGAFGKEIARGLRLRCDWGPQYIADAWINEVKWLGITISPSYVGEPQCNGVAERFMRTLKEQCLYLHQFTSLAEARTIISVFIERYNTQWLIERLGHQTPAAARATAMAA